MWKFVSRIYIAGGHFLSDAATTAATSKINKQPLGKPCRAVDLQGGHAHRRKNLSGQYTIMEHKMRTRLPKHLVRLRDKAQAEVFGGELSKQGSHN
jgi:hypothetical protein